MSAAEIEVIKKMKSFIEGVRCWTLSNAGARSGIEVNSSQSDNKSNAADDRFQYSIRR